MARSSAFQTLAERASKLRTHLIPEKPDPVGEYSDQVLDSARGYKLLIHAEIEWFLEVRAKSLVDKASTTWSNTKKPSRILTSLLVSWNTRWKVDEEFPVITPTREQPKSIEDGVVQAVVEFQTLVKINHGIKRKNLLLLLAPLGIDVASLDSSWVNGMDAFGAKRGVLAHQGVEKSPQINPFDEVASTDQLLEGLAVLDDLLSALEAEL